MRPISGNPLVSVIMPIYNVEPYLETAFNSVVNQTYENWEFLIVDDGSTDRSPEIIKDLINAHSISKHKFFLIEQLNQGAAAARNTGISKAKGELLAFIDGDDYWSLSLLEKSVQTFIEDSTITMTFPWYKLIDQCGCIHGTGKTKLNRINFSQVFLKNPIHTNTGAVISKSAIDHVGLFDARLSSNIDFDLWLRLAAQFPESIKCVKEILVAYRTRPGQITGSWKKMSDNWSKVVEKCQNKNPALVASLFSRAHCHQLLYWSMLANRENDFISEKRLVQKALETNTRYCLSTRFGLHRLAVTLLRWPGLNKTK